jgi:hypothetical protein
MKNIFKLKKIFQFYFSFFRLFFFVYIDRKVNFFWISGNEIFFDAYIDEVKNKNYPPFFSSVFVHFDT